MLWSPFPVSTVKRVIQEFGCVLTALIFLTEEDPAASLRVVFTRVSYVLFPLSVVFIRYFPEIGRVVSFVSGTHMLTGVTGHKNSLGEMAMVFCLVLIWDLLETRKHDPATQVKPERLARLISLVLGLYLLLLSSSATAWVCFLLGFALLFAGKRLSRMKNAKLVFMLSVFSIFCMLMFEQAFGISDKFSVAMGRGAGLTGRTEIWRVTLEKHSSHLIGHGFRGFWETSEGASVALDLQTNVLITAHNGYIETYLHGGLVALILLGALIWSTGLNAMHRLVIGDSIGRLAIVFWSIILINNVTESLFFQIGTLWFTFLLVAIDIPWQDNSWNEIREMDSPNMSDIS
jgi:O-antigen ligase